MIECDYLERTIATVRQHQGADNCWPQWANIFADEIERLWAEEERLLAQRENLVARLEADPVKVAAATLDGLRTIFSEDDAQTVKILDWIGVARHDVDGEPLAISERVRVLALELAVRQGWSIEEAERLAPAAFPEIRS